MAFSKLEIQTDGLLPKGGKFLLDGHEIRGLRELRLDFVSGEPNQATITVLVDEVKVDAGCLNQLRGLVVSNPESMSEKDTETFWDGARDIL